MLKFEALANVGDVIKAFDFMPRPGVCEDMFMTGIVTAKGPIYVDRNFGGEIRKVYMCDGYTIKIIGADDETKAERIGDTGYVPFEVSMMEYDNRIELVATVDDLKDIAEEFASVFA